MKARLFVIIAALLTALVMISCTAISTFSSDVTDGDAPIIIMEETASVPTRPDNDGAEKNTSEINSAKSESIISETMEAAFTVVTRKKLNDNEWQHAYENKAINLQGLRIELITFSPQDLECALKLRLTLPESWDTTIAEWVMREGLRFRYEVDNVPVDAFRERSLTNSTGANTYEMLFRKCILSQDILENATVVSITPYIDNILWVKTHETIDSESGKTLKQYSLAAGDQFTGIFRETGNVSNASYIWLMKSERLYLYESSIVIPLNVSEETNKANPSSVIKKITVWDDDNELNIRSGCYEDGSQIPLAGRIYSTEKDFSQVSFVLEGFHIWPEEIKLSYGLYFPETWSSVETRSFVGNDLYFYIYADDDRPEEIQFGVDQPIFGSLNYKFCASLHQIGENPSWQNYQTESYRELHFVNWDSNISAEMWKTKSKVTILPWYLRVTNYQGQPVTGSGIDYSSGSGETTMEQVFLDEIAITVDITEDLFADGF